MTDETTPEAARNIVTPYASFPDNVVYISDERVAASYGAWVGDYATINDPDERAWLVANSWAYDRNAPSLPSAYFHGNRGPWLGYQPEPPPEPPAPPPAARKARTTSPPPASSA